MTDIIRESELSIEDRLDLLEQRLGVGINPLALVPPITIGSLTNVPVPGSQIAAQWAQDVSGIALHRFPTKAALNGWAAPTGAYAVTTDTGVLWRRVATGWSQVTPWTGIANGITTGPGGIGGGTVTGAIELATLTIPADPGPRVADVSCSVRVESANGTQTYVSLYVNSIPIGQYAMLTGGVWNAILRGTYPIPVNTAAVATVVIGTTASVWTDCKTYPDLFLNRLDAIAVPRGY